jgi:putative Holliday junction resolvase
VSGPAALPPPPRPAAGGRVVALDLGERRVGVAVCDAGGVLAVPHGTLVRGTEPGGELEELVALVEQIGAVHVVVGLPLGLDGRPGPAARRAEAEARALARALSGRGVTVETFDERLTTVSAERQLEAAGRRGRRRRAVVDQAAAAVLLQAWLDGRRGPGPGRGPEQR